MSIKKNRSIFSAILAAFMLMVMPVYAAGYLVYRWGTTRLRNEMALSQSVQTRYYMEKFHSDIQRTIKQQSGLSSDRDVIMLSAFGEDYAGENSPSVETMFAIKRIQARLTSIMDSSDIIENVTIHISSINKSIHSIGSISDLTPEEYLELKNISDRNEGQVLFRDNIPISMVASQVQYTSKGKLPAHIVAIVVTDIWKNFGFGTIVYLSALTSVDPNLYESAVIDGANRWQQTRHITLPGISTTVVLLSVLSMGNILNAGFEQIFNLYSPIVYSTGDIIDTLVYRTGMQNYQFGVATAVGLMKSLVAFIMIALSNQLARRIAGYKVI